MSALRPVAALVLAAGRGSRAGGDLPKQYQILGGEAVLARSLRAFLDHPGVDFVVPVIHPDDGPLYQACAPVHAKLLPPAAGQPTRQASARSGLMQIASLGPKFVLIHDAARPFVSADLISQVIAALADHPAAAPAVPVTDTLKQSDGAGRIAATIPREGLFAVQTPQGFRFEEIVEAHARAAAASLEFTDDAAIAEWRGIAVQLVPSDAGNVKITTAEDMALASLRLVAPMAASETRVGTGYDVHALGPGESVMLGGLSIPHDRALIGHSDADVALHALTDAVLGALAEGDIGLHFPPSDPALRGASSDRFLADAVARVRARGGEIVHLDLSILAEAPRIGPHREAMRNRIASICAIAPSRVAVKATTNERLGFIGRREGIAALATATIRLPIEER